LVPGSKISVVEKRVAGPLPRPPVTSTLPPGSSVAAWLWRATRSGAAATTVLVVGSKRSTFGTAGPPLLPPTNKIFPFVSVVAVSHMRAVDRSAPADHVRVVGLQTSVVAVIADDSASRPPPSTMTFPGLDAAAALVRARIGEPAGDHALAAAS
jgi:hypothetical protein